METDKVSCHGQLKLKKDSQERPLWEGDFE